MSSPGEAEAVAKIEKQETKVKEAEAKVEKAKGEVQEAETKVEKAESRVKEAEAKIEKAKEEVKEAKKEVQVTQTGGTELQKEAAQKGLDSAQKGLESAQKGLESAQKGLESAQKGLESAQEGVKTAQRLWNIAVASLERASADAGAAGDESMGLEMRIQQLTLDLALESKKNHILITRGNALFEEVYTEFTAYVENKHNWLRGGESAPAPVFSETASVSSSSTGSDASKVLFPNDCVDCSRWSVESEQVPDFLKPLLWKMQQRLVSMYDAFGTSSMGEVDYIQPVIRAFCSVVVKGMDLNRSLKVVYPGDGVRVNVNLSGTHANGSPDIVFHSKMRAPKGHWTEMTVSRGVKKLCQAVILGEVKKNQATVRNASDNQARWYLFGAAQCLSEQVSCKGLVFGATRTCFCTDGFCWKFMQSTGVPAVPAGTSKWSVEASDLLDQADDIVKHLTRVLKTYDVEASTKFKEAGISDDKSKEGGSLSDADSCDEDRNDSEQFDALESSDDDKESFSQQHYEGSQLGMTAQKLFGTPSSLQRRSSSASESGPFRKRTLHVRGDGLPRGLNTKAFVEMQSRERVLAFLGM